MTVRQKQLIENYIRLKVKKVISEKNMLKEGTMRAVKVTYSDGNSISTNMNGQISDDEIKRYYKIGSVATFERNGQEKKVKITNVEILPDETY